MSKLRAYKRSPGLSNSTWYKGILTSQMAGAQDNDGAFDIVLITMRRGTEPPPHVHSREHEFFHILSGEMKAYVGCEVFELRAGDCLFLPLGVPHAFRLLSEETQWVALITPGGFFDAINKMNVPAERMELPADDGTVTYATVDMADTIAILDQIGLRFLTEDEIREEMPEYCR